MDILAMIKDPAVIAGIIGLVETLKVLLAIKSKKILLLLPLALGLIAGVVLGWGTWQGSFLQGVVYAGVASFAYQFGKTFIPGGSGGTDGK